MTELRYYGFKIQVENEEGVTKTKQFRRAVTDLDGTVDYLNSTLGDNVKVTADVVQGEKEAVAQARLAATQYQKNQNRVKALSEEYRQMSALVGLSADEQQVLNAQFRLGANATEAQKQEVAELVKSYQMLRDSQNQTQGSMRNLRGVAQNFGWQLQDTVVQLQMGTSAFTVLSQQGSQMASAFGPGGAILGAVIALSGAIAGALVPSLFDGADATGDLEEATKALDGVLQTSSLTVTGITQDMIELYKADRNLASLRLTAGAVEAEQALETFRTQTLSALDAYVGMAKAVGGESEFLNFGEAAEALGLTTEQFGELQKAVERFRETGDSSDLSDVMLGLLDTTEKLSPEMQKLVTEYVDLEQGSELARRKLEAIKELMDGELSDATRGAIEDVDALIDSYTDKTLALDTNARQMAINTALLSLSADATDEEREAVVKSINTYYDRVESQKAASEAERQRAKDAKAAEKAIEKAAKAEQKRIMDGIALSIKAENQRVKNRDALLNDIQKGINDQEMEGEDARITESRLYNQNMQALINERNATLEHEFVERQRIDALLEDEQRRHSAVMTEIMQAETQAQLNSYSQTLSAASTVIGQLSAIAEEGSAEARALFYANQAIAFANAIVSAEMGAAKALELGPVLGIPASNLIRGLGYASAGIIAGTTLAGAFDEGGVIPAGQKGIVAEYGDELVGGTMVYNNSQSGLKVTGRKETAELMNQQGGGGVVVQQYITVQGNGDKALEQAMRAAAQQGAEEGAKKGYAMVQNDFSTGRGIRSQLRRSIGA